MTSGSVHASVQRSLISLSLIYSCPFILRLIIFAFIKKTRKDNYIINNKLYLYYACVRACYVSLFCISLGTKQNKKTSSEETLKDGLDAIVDGQRCGWRTTKTTVESVTTILGDKLRKLYIVRPDGFWDKQRLENCTKAQKNKDVCRFISICNILVYDILYSFIFVMQNFLISIW